MRAAVLISVGVVVLVACDQPRTPTMPTRTSTTTTPPTPVPPSAPPSSNANAEQYALTLSIGNSCGVVPESDRTRTYSATIQRIDSQRSIVTLGEGRFLSGPICTGGSGRFRGVGCDQFFTSEDLDTALFWLDNNNDEAHGGHIVEQVPSGGWWEVIGSASGLRTAQSIDASGTADVWYCPSRLGYPFPCTAFTSCRGTELRLRFTRR